MCKCIYKIEPTYIEVQWVLCILQDIIGIFIHMHSYIPQKMIKSFFVCSEHRRQSKGFATLVTWGQPVLQAFSDV